MESSVLASEGGSVSRFGRIKYLQDREEHSMEDAGSERGSDGSEDTVSTKFRKDRKFSGDQKALVGEDERKAFFFFVADDYQRRSSYKQPAEISSFTVLRICV